MRAAILVEGLLKRDDESSGGEEGMMVRGGKAIQRFVASCSPTGMFWVTILCFLFLLYIILDITWYTYKKCRTLPSDYLDLERPYRPNTSDLYDAPPSAPDVLLPPLIERNPTTLNHNLSLFRSTGRLKKKAFGGGPLEETIVSPLDGPARRLSDRSTALAGLLPPSSPTPELPDDPNPPFSGESDRLILPGSVPDSMHLHTSEIGSPITDLPPRIPSPPSSSISGWFASTSRAGEALVASRIAAIQDWKKGTSSTSPGIGRKQKVSKGSRGKGESGLRNLVLSAEDTQEKTPLTGTCGMIWAKQFVSGQERATGID